MAIEQNPEHPDGVTGSENASGKDLARAKERKEASVWKMKLSGASWDDIAEVLGYPTGRHALVAYERYLEREIKNDPHNQERLRVLAGRRLERLLQGVWGKAIDPTNPEQLQALGKAREILAEYSKLFGLHAPTEIAIHTPTREALEQWVAQMQGGSQFALEEADVLEGEVEEIEDAG